MDTTQPYFIHEPTGPARPLIVDSPHSGSAYPADFGHACGIEALRRAEDNYIDELFSGAVDHGAVFLGATFPRCYIDANRSPDDIDPELLDAPWPGDLSRGGRAHAGNGLIRRLIRPGVPIYDRKLPIAEIEHRLEHYYRPYHLALERLLNRSVDDFGEVWHLNVHSMPNMAARTREKGILPIGTAVDMVIGDHDGTTGDPDLILGLRDFLIGRGYRVSINDPYKGVEILRRHADPARNRFSIQLEINKALYMDEKTLVKTANYSSLEFDINKALAWVGAFIDARRMPIAAD